MQVLEKSTHHLSAAGFLPRPKGSKPARKNAVSLRRIALDPDPSHYKRKAARLESTGTHGHICGRPRQVMFKLGDASQLKSRQLCTEVARERAVKPLGGLLAGQPLCNDRHARRQSQWARDMSLVMLTFISGADGPKF